MAQRNAGARTRLGHAAFSPALLPALLPTATPLGARARPRAALGTRSMDPPAASPPRRYGTRGPDDIFGHGHGEPPHLRARGVGEGGLYSATSLGRRERRASIASRACHHSAGAFSLARSLTSRQSDRTPRRKPRGRRRRLARQYRRPHRHIASRTPRGRTRSSPDSPTGTSSSTLVAMHAYPAAWRETRRWTWARETCELAR